MSLPRRLLHALGVALLAAIGPGGAAAQQTDRPLADFTPLVPPVFPLPPATKVAPGEVGGVRTPYTTAPLQNPTQSPTQSAPGIKLTIPTR